MPARDHVRVAGVAFATIAQRVRAQRVTVLIAEKELVPDEGIEPPTFGLQNRCSTAELIRLPVCRWRGERDISRARRSQGFAAEGGDIERVYFTLRFARLIQRD